MKNEKLYDAISDIREEFIEEAGEYKFKKRIVPQVVKWGSMAACFCLLILGASYMMNSLFARKSDVDNYNGSVVPTQAPMTELQKKLTYNGALYNISNDLNYLNVAGIPEIIDAEDCGISLGNLTKTENGYKETTQDTDIEIYKYASALSNSAVVVVRDGEEYMAGLFSNYYAPGEEETYSPLSELYRAYGVESAENIIMVAEVNNANEGVIIGEKINNADSITQFYEATMNTESECYSWDAFREMVLDKMSAMEYNQFIETQRALCIETGEGLKFYVSWYPETGWLYSKGTLAYYKVTEELKNWLDTYMK